MNINFVTILNLLFAGVSAVCAVISVLKAKEITEITNNVTVKGKNNSTGDITGGDKVTIEKYVAKEIVNDEDFIKEVASKITDKKLIKYTENGHPPTYVRNTINGPNLETKAIIYTQE